MKDQGSQGLDAAGKSNLRLYRLIACSALVLGAAGWAMCMQGLEAAHSTPATTRPGLPPTHPSNAQLADPKIEARVETLLGQMTLEEKIGQLVQYNDSGDEPAAASLADQAKPRWPGMPQSIPSGQQSCERHAFGRHRPPRLHAEHGWRRRAPRLPAPRGGERAACIFRCCLAQTSFTATAPFIRSRWDWPPASIPRW